MRIQWRGNGELKFVDNCLGKVPILQMVCMKSTECIFGILPDMQPFLMCRRLGKVIGNWLS